MEGMMSGTLGMLLKVRPLTIEDAPACDQMVLTRCIDNTLRIIKLTRFTRAKATAIALEALLVARWQFVRSSASLY